MDSNQGVFIPFAPLDNAWTLNTQWSLNLAMYSTNRLQFNAIMYWSLFDLSARSYGFNRFGSHDGT